MLEGLPPNGATHVMRLSCDELSARRVADLIVESFDPATTAACAFEETPFPERGNGRWAVEIYFGSEPDEDLVRTLVALAAGEAASGTLVFGEIEEQDWIATALENLPPVRAGRFLMHGAHGRNVVKANDIGIEIEAALAFGTGHHGSTQGCLQLLGSVARRRRPRAILDIGTGSGVLAIAAAKLFKRRISAGDIDPVAVMAAMANARRNQVTGYVRPVRARGATHPLLRKSRYYDLLLANILARPLCDLAPEIAWLAAPGADIILSGLIASDVASVLSAYRVQDMFLKRRLDVEGWISLLLRRA